MPSIFLFGVIIAAAFFFGGLANKLKLPKITGFIIAGIILNPSLTHFIPADFASQATPITNIALAFITFAVGGALWYPRIKKLGKDIFYITIFEAEFSFLAVAIGSCLALPFFLHSSTATWTTVFIPLSLLLAALAAPTDASGILAVVHQYKAKGPVTSTIIAVDAVDDVFGIINYSIATVVASAMIMQHSFSLQSFFREPFVIIAGSILLGIALGIIFNLLSPFVKKGSEGVLIIMVLGLLSLGFGLATMLGIDELLVTMVMGIAVVNFNVHKDEIFRILERYTEQLILLLFFTLSGMYLNLVNFADSLIFILLFFVFRTIGKYTGTMLGGFLAKAPVNVRKHTAGGLIPLGGITVGLALMMKEKPVFGAISDFIISIIIGSTVVHEIIGPIMTKWTLKKAGEI